MMRLVVGAQLNCKEDRDLAQDKRAKHPYGKTTSFTATVDAATATKATATAATSGTRFA